MEIKTLYSFLSLILLGLILHLWTFFCSLCSQTCRVLFKTGFPFLSLLLLLVHIEKKKGYKVHAKLGMKILACHERKCCQISQAISGRCSLLNNFSLVMKDKAFHVDKHKIFPVFLTTGIGGLLFFCFHRQTKTN